jgi:nitrogen fixation/metabolism regulation signal transduction histidine kinase
MQNQYDVGWKRFLLNARVQFTRLTLEELPIGSIVLDEHGVIQNIDALSEGLFERGDLPILGRNVTTIVGEDADAFLDRLCTASVGSSWQTQLRTSSGGELNVTMTLTQSSAPRRYVLSIFYAPIA